MNRINDKMVEAQKDICSKKYEVISFDFDEWAALAVENPEKFELKRKAWLNRLIEQAPMERRKALKELKFRCDRQRKPQVGRDEGTS